MDDPHPDHGYMKAKTPSPMRNDFALPVKALF
jgi:hypothetical protein